MYCQRKTGGKQYIISRRISLSLAFLKKNGGLEMLDNMMDGSMVSLDPSMSLDYQIILIASVVILLIFPLLMLWGWRKGQFKDIEDAKYRVIENEEDHVD
jgi:cbb3-type cytochrome oxidase maturation protein